MRLLNQVQLDAEATGLPRSETFLVNVTEVLFELKLAENDKHFFNGISCVNLAVSTVSSETDRWIVRDVEKKFKMFILHI